MEISSDKCKMCGEAVEAGRQYCEACADYIEQSEREMMRRDWEREMWEREMREDAFGTRRQTPNAVGGRQTTGSRLLPGGRGNETDL
jgi:hypothetical protein